MENKKRIMTAMVIGSLIGGYIPSLWDDSMLSMFSLSSVIFGAIGGFLGIWIGYKLGE